jgi:hypothetical protein
LDNPAFLADSELASVEVLLNKLDRIWEIFRDDPAFANLEKQLDPRVLVYVVEKAARQLREERLCRQETLRKLVRETELEFAQLAKVSSPHFHPLIVWQSYVLNVFSGNADLEEFIYDTKNKASALCKQLGKLYRRLEPGWVSGHEFTLYHGGQFHDATEIDDEALKELMEHTIGSAESALSGLIKQLSQFAPLRPRGRARGATHYPGLADLVYNMEYGAKCGGGGFTFHRKEKGVPKGTLVQALDRLRERLAAASDLRPLADFIPPRNKHPVAVYESALERARRDADTIKRLRHTPGK